MIAPLGLLTRFAPVLPAAPDPTPAGPARPRVPGDRLVTSTPALSTGARDADYGRPDPGAGRRGAVRQLQLDLQALGYFGASHATGGYFQLTRAAVSRFQADNGLPVTGRADAATLEALSHAAPRQPAGRAPRTANPRPAEVPAPTGRVAGQGLVKDGMRIPNGGEGRGTVFANGHIAYKGWTDRSNRQNGGRGAWGDANRPTDYFVALPVSGDRWHNQKILVTNPTTGKQVVALVQDKGPGRWTGAKIDLSPVVMEGLGVDFRRTGEAHVRFEFAPANAPVGPVG